MHSGHDKVEKDKLRFLGFSNGQSVTVKASIGVATGPLTDASAVLRVADEAMYTAKRNGKNSYATMLLDT